MLDTWRAWTPRQRARALLTSAIVILAVLVLYEVRGALTPFCIGLLLAYLVWPAVRWLEVRLPRWLRGRVGRTLAIVLVYLVGLGLLAGFFAYLVPVIVRQVEQLIASREVLFDAIRDTSTGLQRWYLETVPPDVRTLFDSRLRNLGDQLLPTLGEGIAGSLTVVRNVISLLLGYLVIPFWVGFVLYDAERLERSLVNIIPAQARPDVLNLVQILSSVLGNYLRGQILLAAVTGLLSIVALSIVGIQFAVLLGFLAGIFDLIPTLGPILIAIPTFLIGVAERPIKGVWGVVALVAVQQIESLLLAPRIVGRSVRVRPALIILLLVIGADLFGFWGLIIIVPLAALLRDVVVYLYIRTSPEGATPDEALARVLTNHSARGTA